MNQYINRITDFFIKDKEQLTSDALYKVRTLAKIILWMVAVCTLMVIPQLLGYFSEETPFFLVIFFVANLLLMKFTGRELLVSFSLIIGATLIVIYNINETGQIYSYNHKWLISILLLINFSSPKFNFPFLIFAIVFQFYSYATTSDTLQGIGTKEDYFFDNLAFLILPYPFLYFLDYTQKTIQHSKIQNR